MADPLRVWVTRASRDSRRPTITAAPAAAHHIADEVDHFWSKLSAGGEEVQCGWLKDRFGVPWQVVPTVLPDLIKMKKLDIVPKRA